MRAGDTCMTSPTQPVASRSASTSDDTLRTGTARGDNDAEVARAAVFASGTDLVRGVYANEEIVPSSQPAVPPTDVRQWIEQ